MSFNPMFPDSRFRHYSIVQLNSLAWFYYHLAPTITGIKPATLLNLNYTQQHFYQEWLIRQTGFCGDFKFISSITKEIRSLELRHTNGNLLVLFYDPLLLAATLQQDEQQSFMALKGYPSKYGLNDCLDLLKMKFNLAFPHEMGIFLGIPVWDVIGFIENRGKNYLLNKYWKVYQNREYAVRVFDAYDRARAEIKRQTLRSFFLESNV